jgi:primosomal replication protein N
MITVGDLKAILEDVDNDASVLIQTVLDSSPTSVTLVEVVLKHTSNDENSEYLDVVGEVVLS